MDGSEALKSIKRDAPSTSALITRHRQSWCACYIRPHICHREIHAALTEAELARDYSTPEALRAHPRLAKFAAWVAKRPPGFRSKVPGKRRGR